MPAGKLPGRLRGLSGRATPVYSDPLDEQNFIVTTINDIMASPDWASTAIIIAYDDSDGWYDHQMDPCGEPIRRRQRWFTDDQLRCCRATAV